MGKRKDPLIEFRDYYNSLSPDAQDVARRLLFGEARQRPKLSSSAQPAKGRSSSKKPATAGPGVSSETAKDAAGDAPKAAAAGGD